MIKATVIAALSIPVFCAAATGEYTQHLAAARQQAATWQNKLTQVSAELKELGVDLSTPGPQAEIPETEDTVAVADKGLLFDTATSRVIYLGNVRLRDKRAHLNATEQLHIYLQDIKPEKKEKTSPAPATTTSKPGNKAKAAATPTTNTAKPVESVIQQTAEATKALTRQNAPVTESAAPTTEKEVEPALVNTHSAIADSINNAILLYAPAAGETILLQQGENKVQITPGAQSPARILADPEGNILLEGAVVDLRMIDKDGGLTTLKATGGLAFYHAATNTLHVPGKSEFTHPDGTLSCTESLRLVLVPAETPAETKTGFMSQFTGLRFDGIDTATAKGSVVLTGTASQERAATRAEGDSLHYNGKTGECSLEGANCRLTYGNYDIYADQGLHLLANGDIELRGGDIHGTYEREGDRPGAMVKGTFKAFAHVIFRAETGTISTEKGLQMKDAEADFSCTGPAQLTLAPREGAEAPRQKAGMPNLAIAQFGEIARAQARGNVIAHQYDPTSGKCTSELKAATVESDLTTGETVLTSEPGQQLVALHEANRIIITPEAGQVATMHAMANGDVKLSGASISASMVNKDGTTTATCKDYVRLIRAENRLETGSSTELHSPTAILTTNACLNAKLATTGETAPSKAAFSQFRFNFNGIEEATTAEGCTLRTEQGSMQCTGPVHIVMNPGEQKADAPMGALKYATATGEVAIAGKDNTGRLIRATGDKLTIDAATGMKVLSGKRVTLGDANNTHIITGKGAAIRIDARNNVKIEGSSHKTHATNVRKQLDASKNKKQKK